MRRTFGKDQDKALGDIIRTSLMLQYNYRDPSRARAQTDALASSEPCKRRTCTLD